MGDLLTPAEVADRLAVTASTIVRWLREGRIRGIQLPTGTWRVPASEVERILMTGKRGGE